MTNDVIKGADISPCGRYRYSLWRIWDTYCSGVVWIMLNPSTADAEADDPTIRRCRSFARLWGYGGIVVVNLFAWRATDPRELVAAADPVGPENDAAIGRACSEFLHVPVICAWGAHGYRHAERVSEVRGILARLEAGSACLGLTKKRQPRHPLYVPIKQERIPWS